MYFRTTQRYINAQTYWKFGLLRKKGSLIYGTLKQQSYEKYSLSSKKASATKYSTFLKSINM